MEHTRAFVLTSWALRLIVVVILLQTLFFKFSAAKESVYIFSTLGAEPWGRIGSGVFELVASILLLIPSTLTIGAAMALAATGSAILLHLTRLGIALTPVGDHGELFALAIVVTVCSIGVLLLHRQELPLIGRSLSTSQNVTSRPWAGVR
jgi:hypothetical protein